MKLTVPELSLVVLMGTSGSGKSTFARKHFKPTEILSSDFCRGLVSDDENSQEATNDAFEILRHIAEVRLTRGLLTVIDATNVQEEARKPLVALAREHDVLPVAIVLKVPEDVCHERNRHRADRKFGPHVIRSQFQQLRRSLRGLEREGFRYVHVLNSLEEVEAAEIVRQPLWNNRKWDRGPFDIIGDVHGCFDELIELLRKLGYAITEKMGENGGGPAPFLVTPPAGRKAVFVGDLVDRGPKVAEVLRLVMDMAQAGHALCVPGNHDVKLLRKLRGKNVQITHGLAETLEQLQAHPPEFSSAVEKFIDGMVGHYVLDEGRLAVAHAGLKQQYIGRASGRVREFALYGETTGETDEFGLPVRNNWAAEYRGGTSVIYGHTPVPQADWLNRTLNIDTGCVFGGALTALRWPERDIISVPAVRTYCEPSRPFLPASPATPNPLGTNAQISITNDNRQWIVGATSTPLSERTTPVVNFPALTAQQAHDDVLDIDDVIGKRLITTRLHHNVTVREENGIAALEIMSRFAANPKWLIYLPPTMSPTETTTQPGLLEHPLEAFGYFRGQGVATVVCQEKHMGSRAVVVICRDEAAAMKRFAIADEGIGIIYTRTGRRFFEDRAMESAVLRRVHEALTAGGFWEEFSSDWFCLDCELMPWSAKAQELLKGQYAAVGSAARAEVGAAIPILREANIRYSARDDSSLGEVLHQQEQRLTRVEQYVEAYRRYCWPVASAEDLRLAPFHLLASEGAVYADKDHLWHMQTLGRLVDFAKSAVLKRTKYQTIDLADPASVEGGVAWWTDLTAQGGEGMVVKPRDFVVRGPRGLAQPAVKCRGREYLRIIYGPEYDAPENLARLRSRGVAAKRSLALREFALGIEALERFARREPLRKVHECVFGVLALESEPVDPRL